VHRPVPQHDAVGHPGHTEIADGLIEQVADTPGTDPATVARIAIHTFGDVQRQAADASKATYQKALAAKGLSAITTEIAPSDEFYFAEDYHQQYLAKNPRGYCGLGGTGVSCPIGVGVTA